MNNIAKNCFRFLFLVLFQVLILRHIHISGLINPFVYILFIIVLPFNVSRGLLLILGFLSGLIIDYFYCTVGMHAFACLLIAFLRPYLLRLIIGGRDYDMNNTPDIAGLGFDWFAAYAAVMVLTYQTVFCFIEVFTFAEMWTTLLRIILSSIVSLLLIIIIQFIFTGNRKKR